MIKSFCEEVYRIILHWTILFESLTEKLFFQAVSTTTWTLFICAYLEYKKLLTWKMVSIAIVYMLCRKILKENNFVKIVEAIAGAFKK